jgi:hypothetical protein
MAIRVRRGMLIKNLGERPLSIRMGTRKLSLQPGEEAPITPQEVRDQILRDHLQMRTIAIVRPSTPEEDEELKQRMAGEANAS